MGSDLSSEKVEEFLAATTRINWSKTARPQQDGYDSDQIKILAQIVYGEIEKSEVPPGRPKMFGIVPLVHYPWDPSPELFCAPFDHPHIKRAEEILSLWPAMYKQCADLLTEVWPITDSRFPDPRDHGAGCSCGDTKRWGGVMSTLAGSLGFAEGIVHELGHHKMHAMGVHLEDWIFLVANTPDEMFESPIRKDKPRPMGACIQAQYSYLHVLELNIIAQSNGVPANMLELNRDRMRSGRETLKNWRPTPGPGEAFAVAMDVWTVELLDRADALLGK